MSSLIVEICNIDNILPILKADNLELAVVKGWQSVIQKGSFKVGDKCIYIPIDSILPPEVETKIFPIESKIKLNKSRVRTIKLRGAISQGLIVNPADFNLQHMPVGVDVGEFLRITKYEPPAPKAQGMQNNQVAKKNPHFREYTDIENFKHYSDLFEEGEEVVAYEKIHGTNFRAGWVLTHANTFWKKIKKFFGFLPEYEFVYGSRHVQLQDKLMWEGYYDKNVYAECVKNYQLKDKLGRGEVIYGEIYGASIQKGYTYGCSSTERKLACFDVQVNGEYLSIDAWRQFCADRGIPKVPGVYRGPYSADALKPYVSGPSLIDRSQKVREGLVLRPVQETRSVVGRKILKMINDDYLLADNTEFH